jgi:hypothetical protein
MGRRLVRSKVWLKGVEACSGLSWVVVFVEDRSGRTVTYPSAGCWLLRKEKEEKSWVG